MDLQEEQQLVKEALHDKEAFGRLYDAYYSKILSYLIARTGEVELARDLCSDVFFKALDKLWQFRFRRIPFSAWLYRIARNEANQHFRKHKKPAHSLEFLLEQGFEVEDPNSFKEEILEAERVLERQTEFSRVQEILKTLPEYYQEVIFFRFFQDKKISEIAEIMNTKEGTVKSWLSRALSSIRKDPSLQRFQENRI